MHISWLEIIWLPFLSLIDVKEDRLSRWQRIEQIQQHFWLIDYLNELLQRTKWKLNAPSLKPGDLVVVQKDNIPLLCWLLAQIETVHPGLNGVVHTATIRIAKGAYKRHGYVPFRCTLKRLLVHDLSRGARSWRGEGAPVANRRS